MKNNFSKVFLIFLALFFSSCTKKDPQQARIRIVDLQGHSRAVVTRVPELNVSALNSQGIPTEQLPPQNTAQKFQPLVPEISAQNNSPAIKNSNEEMLAAGEDPNKTIEYDLAKTEEEKAPATKITEKKSRKSALKNNKKAATASARTSTKTKGFFVQVGSFANKANADQTLEKMQSFHEGQIESGTKEKIIYRVLLGPFNNKKEASEILAKITNSGHEAIIVKK